MTKICVVTKTTKWECLSEEKKQTLSDDIKKSLQESDYNHRHAIYMFKHRIESDDSKVYGHEASFDFYTMKEISELNPSILQEYDIFVSMGGDGVALFLSKYIQNQPLVSVNTDPYRSTGYICNVSINHPIMDISGIFLEIDKMINCNGQLIKKIPRLSVRFKDKEYPFLNDILFTNENPAEMSVYRFYRPNENNAEIQRSSGIWISTGMGSTGGIHSAGVTPVDKYERVVLWKVREPYERRERIWYKEGGYQYTQEHDSLITLEAINPGMCIYRDGSQDKIPIDVGEKFDIIPAPYDLNLDF